MYVCAAFVDQRRQHGVVAVLGCEVKRHKAELVWSVDPLRQTRALGRRLEALVQMHLVRLGVLE